MPKLNYKIVRKETINMPVVTGSHNNLQVAPVFIGPEMTDRYHVEWTHVDGPFRDTVMLPTTHPKIHPSMPDLSYEEVEVQPRDVLHDQVDVPAGTDELYVVRHLEKKRDAIAKAVGVEP